MKINKLLLICLSLVIPLIAFINIKLRFNSPIDGIFWTIVLILAVLILAIYILINIRFPSSDPLLFPIVVVLNGIGLAQIYRIDFAHQRAFGDEYSFAVRTQLMWSVVGLIILLAILIIFKDYRTIRRFTWTSMFVGLVLVILPLFPSVGAEINGAKVWVSLGPLGTFQPAEFAKIFLAVFFAGYLTVNQERLKSAGSRIMGIQLPRIQDFGPILMVWILSLAVLVLQHDLGTSLLFFGMFIGALYISTGKTSWVLIGVGMFGVGSFLAFKLFAHVAARVDIWINPFSEAIYNRSFGGSGQLVQGFFALASGGLFGTGLGNGYPRLTPFSNSDFIYTSLGEELGITGLFAILFLYLLFVQRGISMSLKAHSHFEKLLASCISFGVALQVFVVVGGITKIIPLTGLTLPFIARGGSSLIANWAICALLILISSDVYRVDEIKEFTVSNKQLSPLLQGSGL
ncbi:MAG: FtsW/RodA/SpoVE family cell cycle protein [Candidatus Ancillula sp.]|nr:FtsW/RodA/SpoVE family cell cycle protein [Candidatus Ancillula sp.]